MILGYHGGEDVISQHGLTERHNNPEDQSPHFHVILLFLKSL
jgi:hypothetical protein